MVAPLLREKDAGEDSDRAEPQDGHNLAVANAPASSEICSAVSTSGKSVAERGSVAPMRTTSVAETTKRL